MPSSGPDRMAPEVAAYLGSLPRHAADEVARIRGFVHRVAEEVGVGPLAESVKWGEPSYTPAKSGIGSSVRIGTLRDGRVAMHFICHAGLVERFRELYPETLEYAGNRSIVIGPGTVDEAALSHCIGMALTYHRDRRGR